MNIYISGSIAYDRIMDFPGRFSDHILPDKIHILNVCFTVNGMVEKFGGTAGNIGYSLALLGERPVVIATIGKDYGNYFSWFERHGISTEQIKVIDTEFTAGAYITTDKADNQITGFNPGAMKHVTDFRFDGIDPSHAVVIIAAGNPSDMIGYAARCRERGIRFICDPGQSLTLWDGETFRRWIEGSMILISNDYELELIMSLTGMDKAQLLDLTGTIITTLGEQGCSISARETHTAVPSAWVADVVDPTGAGDAFRAGLIKGIVTGKDLETAAKMGAVAAAYAIEHYGTQEHVYTYAQFCERYRQNFGHLR